MAKTLSRMQYLYQPHKDGNWQVTVDVPKKPVAKMGKKRFTQSLKTSEQRVAISRGHGFQHGHDITRKFHHQYTDIKSTI